MIDRIEYISVLIKEFGIETGLQNVIKIGSDVAFISFLSELIYKSLIQDRFRFKYRFHVKFHVKIKVGYEPNRITSNQLK